MSYDLTSNVKTQIISREPPERELQSADSDPQTTSDPPPSGNVFSESSVLSDGWCISVLGKPCANLKIYSKDSDRSRINQRKKADQGGVDKIGNFFSKNDGKDQTSSRVYNSAGQTLDTGYSTGSRRREEGDLESVEQLGVLDNSSIQDTLNVAVKATESSQQEEFTAEDAQQCRPSFDREIFDSESFPGTSKGEDTSRRETQKIAASTNGTVLFIERDKIGPSLNLPEINIEVSKPRKLLCYCDEDSQTSPPSILKHAPISKSDPVFSNQRYSRMPDKRNQKTSTATMDTDRYPERERQKPLLTRDMVQQTSDDFFFRDGKDSAINTEQSETTNTSINTINCDSVRVQTSQRTSLSAEGEYGVWRNGEMKMNRLCRCSPPGLTSMRRQSSFSSPSESPRTEDSYHQSQRLSSAPRKPQSRQLDSFRTSEEGGYVFCVPPCEECPRMYPRHDNNTQARAYHSTLPKQKQRLTVPKQRQAVVVSCEGICRRCLKKTEAHPEYQPAEIPYRPPPPPPQQYESSSEEGEEDDDGEEEYTDGFVSDGSRKHLDLPYQNNEEYLGLVQELEETLQSRNRNRVNRAMKEFERNSKFNRPLEKPILNYEESSESEEPIMRKISELTEKRRNCKGDCCGCWKNEAEDRRPVRAKPALLNKYDTSASGAEKARWQMDQTSGEWYKVCEKLPKRRPPGARSAKKEQLCRCTCSCGR